MEEPVTGAESADKLLVNIISLGIVAYNEQDSLPGLLQQVRAQDFPHERIEIVLVNSASTDSTRAIMEQFAAENAAGAGSGGAAVAGAAGESAGAAGAAGAAAGFARVQVLDNPARIQAAGWNVAIQNFTGDALVRVDAHASIPSDFISANVAVLNEGEEVCGGMRPTTIEPGCETPWRQTLYLAEESAFGSSVADYRRECEPRYVDSLFHAAYRRKVLDKVGLFNEQLLRTEDNDFHYRVRQAGYRIKLDPRINSKQFIRSSFSRMLKQKYGNGYWVGRTVFVQPGCLKLYHFAPFVLVVGALLLAAVGAAFTWLPFAVCAALYVLLCCALSVYAVSQSSERNATMIALPVCFAGIHLSYGIGTLFGLIRGLFTKKGKK